jgi:hypothetical protein
MRGKLLAFGVILTLYASATSAQEKASAPIYDAMYCSGRVDGESVPTDTVLITGEGSDYKATFQEGDYVYVNKGSSQGVKVGDEFLVMRPIADPTQFPWFKWQFSILRKIGTLWQDEGRLKVVVTQPNVSIAQIVHSCNYMQRGDIVLPAAERAAPPLKPEEKFDRFAPPSGKSLAMIVIGKDFHVEMGTNEIVYVNLGSNQGVKLGDYFRVFRYTGQQNETAYQDRRFPFQVYGFGGVSSKYTWENVPREVVGEGIVLRATPNASTVLITFSLSEIYAGNYVELE